MQHLDEGTIHAWLDGQLQPVDATAAEAHVRSCAECSMLVAEARGFIAASSRIMSALDDVPGGVIPLRGDEVQNDLSRKRAERNAAAGRARARSWWRHPGVAAAAAVVVVAIGSYRVLTRVPDTNILRDERPQLSPAPRLDSVVPVAIEAAPASPPTAKAPGRSTARARDELRATASMDRAAEQKDDTAKRRQLRLAGQQPVTTTATGSMVAATAVDSLSAKARARDSALFRSQQDSARRGLALEEVVVTGTSAAVPPPRPSASEREAKERADAQRSALGARVTQLGNVVTTGAAADATAKKAEAGAPLAPACYDLRVETTGNRPMAIAAPRLPSRVRLDTTVASREVDPAQLNAHDLSVGDERVSAVLSWRVAAGGFDLFVERDGTTTRVAVLLVNDQTLERQRALPQPAAAAVFARARVVPCDR